MLKRQSSAIKASRLSAPARKRIQIAAADSASRPNASLVPTSRARDRTKFGARLAPPTSLMGANTSNNLWPRAAVHDSNMTEQTFEIIAEQSACPIPNLHYSIGLARRHAAEELGFQNVIARERLASFVQHHKHAMGAVNIARHDQNHRAILE